MTYRELKAKIEAKEHMLDYYDHILSNAEDILLDISIRGQVLVAIDLGIAQSKLSAIKPLLGAYYNKTKVSHDAINN